MTPPETRTSNRIPLVCEFDNVAFSEYIEKGDRVLVEASPYDTIWGIGMSAGDPDAKDPDKWEGKNYLGFALMEVREMLRGMNL